MSPEELMKPKNDCQSTEEKMVGGTKEWGKKYGTEEEARSVTKMAGWKTDKRVDTTKEKKMR